MRTGGWPTDVGQLGCKRKSNNHATGGCPTEKQFDVPRKKQSRSSTFRSSQLARPKQLVVNAKENSNHAA